MTNPGLVVAGVDTHADTHHVAVIDGVGRRVTDRQFPATAVGYRQIVEFLNAQGPVGAVGVEGTGSYGAELARSLARAGLSVIEVTCSNRSARRLRGKSDPLDAYAAAQAVLAEQAQSVPKSRDGLVEAIRVLRVARGSAIKSRTIAINQIKAILVTAEDGTLASYRGLTNLRMIEALARSRPRTATASAAGATAVSLKILATRCQSLNAEISILDAQLDELTNQLAPGAEGRARRRDGGRCPTAHHRRRQPRAHHHRSTVRRARRSRTDPSLFRQDNPPPPQPGR
jgi:transposase